MTLMLVDAANAVELVRNMRMMVDVTTIPELTNGFMKLKPLLRMGEYMLFARLNDNSFVIGWSPTVDYENHTVEWAQGYYINDFNRAVTLLGEKGGSNG